MKQTKNITDKMFIDFLNTSAWDYRKSKTFTLFRLIDNKVIPSYDNKLLEEKELKDTEENYRKLIAKHLPNIRKVIFWN